MKINKDEWKRKNTVLQGETKWKKTAGDKTPKIKYS